MKLAFWPFLVLPTWCDSSVDGWYKDTQQGRAGGGLDIGTQLGAQREIRGGTGTHFLTLRRKREKSWPRGRRRATVESEIPSWKLEQLTHCNSTTEPPNMLQRSQVSVAKCYPLTWTNSSTSARCFVVKLSIVAVNLLQRPYTVDAHIKMPSVAGEVNVCSLISNISSSFMTTTGGINNGMKIINNTNEMCVYN